MGPTAPTENNNTATVSIVIPSYNQGKFLEQSLLSIIQQDYPATEIIVVDNKSSDATQRIIHKYRDKIAHYISENDKGQSDALNKGFSKATGVWLGWMNADDMYAPDAFNTVIPKANAKPDCLVAYGDLCEINEEGRYHRTHYAMNFSKSRLTHDGFYIYTQAMFWRKSLLAHYGTLPIELRLTMDYDLLQGFARHTTRRNYMRFPKTLGFFRRHEDQKTQTPRGETHFGLSSEAYAEHLKICERWQLTTRFTNYGRSIRQLHRLTRKANDLARFLHHKLENTPDPAKLNIPTDWPLGKKPDRQR